MSTRLIRINERIEALETRYLEIIQDVKQGSQNTGHGSMSYTNHTLKEIEDALGNLYMEKDILEGKPAGTSIIAASVIKK